MTKEEFIRRQDEIEQKIDALKAELEEVGKEYVRTNQPWPVGTKVKITVPGIRQGDGILYGVIKGYELSYTDVTPVIARFNKDGSPSRLAEIHVDWWRRPVVEALEPQNAHEP